MNTPSIIRVEPLRAYAGPSIFAREPVVIARLTIRNEALGDVSARIQRMAAACSAWFEWPHDEAAATPLAVGNFLVAWTRCALTETRGFLHVAKAVAARDSVILILGHHRPGASFLALETAAAILADIDRLTTEDLTARVRTLWRTCWPYHPDYQAVILMTAARAAGIPVLPFSQRTRTWQYGWGARSRVFFESASTSNSRIGNKIILDKSNTKALFRSLGAPTPVHVSIDSLDELPKALETVGYPCVVKPLQGSKGKGVTAGIDSFARAEAGTRATGPSWSSDSSKATITGSWSSTGNSSLQSDASGLSSSGMDSAPFDCCSPN